MIKVIDHFVEDPFEERAFALDLEYKDVRAQGLTYRNIALQGKSERNDALWFRIMKLHTPLVIPVIDFYRLNYGSQKSSTYIHSDKNFADMIGIHFLNLPRQCHGGTAVWSHKASGLQYPPDKPTQGQADLFNLDGLEQSKWNMLNLVEMKFNRFITMHAGKFHSRYPEDLSEWFGDDPETARLVHVFFYNLR